MRHYSCDGCGRDLTDKSQNRFVVKIDAHASQDPSEMTEDDFEDNVVEETAALLRAIEDGLAEDGELTTLPSRAVMEYDLCQDCFARYLKDPIGRSNRKTWAFSTN